MSNSQKVEAGRTSPSPRSLFLILCAAGCFTLAAALLFITGLPERADYTGFFLETGQRVAPEINSLAPPIDTTTLSNDALSLDGLRGSPVIVNFWATWCAPCRFEMAELQNLYEEHRASGLRILAVNLNEPTPLVQQWVDEMGLTYDILPDEDQAIARTYRLFAPPSTFVISPEGIIIQIFFGPVTADQLESVLAPYL